MKQILRTYQAAWQAIHGEVKPVALYRFERARAQLTPFQVSRLDDLFRRDVRDRENAGQTPYDRDRPIRRYFWQKAGQSWSEILADDPRKALVMLHAPEGKLRLEAVCHARFDDAAARALLILRCNDWVGPVREVAAARLRSEMLNWTEAELTELAMFVLNRTQNWTRGGAEVAAEITNLAAWPSAVKDMFMSETSGPLARSLRNQLCRPAFDWALPDLALRAQSSFVRSVAVETILTGQARWFVGYDFEWVDRVFDKRRRVARWQSRTASFLPETRKIVLRKAVVDQSATVRRLAVDALIANGRNEGNRYCEALRTDKSRAVLTRMAFYDKKWGNAALKNQKKDQ